METKGITILEGSTARVGAEESVQSGSTNGASTAEKRTPMLST